MFFVSQENSFILRQLKVMLYIHKIIHTTSLHFAIQKVSALGNYYLVLLGIFDWFIINGHTHLYSRKEKWKIVFFNYDKHRWQVRAFIPIGTLPDACPSFIPFESLSDLISYICKVTSFHGYNQWAKMSTWDSYVLNHGIPERWTKRLYSI